MVSRGCWLFVRDVPGLEVKKLDGAVTSLRVILSISDTRRETLRWGLTFKRQPVAAAERNIQPLFLIWVLDFLDGSERYLFAVLLPAFRHLHVPTPRHRSIWAGDALAIRWRH